MPEKTLTLELVTPEKVALSETADFVVLPAVEGEMGVLPGHEPFIVQLAAGEVRARSGEAVKHLAVAGGFAEIKGDKVSVFAETAEMAEEIDAEKARQALAKARAEAQGPGVDPLTLAQAEAAMRREQARIRVAEMRIRRHTTVRPPEE